MSRSAPAPPAVQAITAMGLHDALGPARGLCRSLATRACAEHRAIARDAWRIELVTPRTVMESMKVLRVGPDAKSHAHRDGI
jgi:hypothetical protein